MGSCKWSLCNFVEGEYVTYDIARQCIEGVKHWYCGPISDSVFGEPNTPQQKRQRYGLSNGSVYEATEPAVKASEAAHEATELVAKASEAAHAQHKDHVFIIRFAMIALGLSTMEASKTWTNSGNLRMPGCSSM